MSFLIYNFANANELLFDDWSGSNSQSLAQKRIAMNNDGNKDNSLYKKQCIKPANLDYDRVDCVRDGLAVVKKDSKYELVDENSKEIIEPKYDFISDVLGHHGRRIVGLDKKIGIIDDKGKLIIPIQYDRLGDMDIDGETFSLVKNGKYGIVDINNNVIVPFEYDYAQNFSKNNLALLKLNNKYGVVNKNYQFIIPLEYDYIFHASVKSGNNIHVRRDGKEGILDLNGSVVIPLECDGMPTQMISDWTGIPIVKQR